MKPNVLLIHGILMNPLEMRYLGTQLEKLGFNVHYVYYQSVLKTPEQNAKVIHDKITKLNLPDLHLVGHSLGGLIAATYLLKHQSKFAAGILSGPAIKAADEPSAFLRFISRILSKILPKMGVIALDASEVSRDPKVVADYEADPLVSGAKISARLGYEMMKQMDQIQSDASKITLPLLMLHGEADSLTAVEGSQFLNDNIGSSEKHLKIYPYLYHEIFNEPEKDQVLTDMTDWIDARLA